MSALRQALAVAGALLAALTSLTAVPAAASAAGPPTIEAAWVTDITATSANLRAEIDPNGSSAHYRFEYLTEAAYLAGGETFVGASRRPVASEPTVPGAGIAVFQHVEGLTPATSYYYRVVATNSALETTAGSAHVLITEEATNVHPPIDARGYELVSPIDKDGGAVAAPESLFGGGDFQAAASSATPALTYGSATAFGEATGSPPASQYISHRRSSGWSTQNVSAPLESGGYGDEPDGAPFRVFSTDLARGLMLNGSRCAVEATCPPSYSLSEGGAFSLLPTAAGLRFEGATSDLRQAVFGAEDGLYEWSGAGLEAIDSEPGGELAAPIGAISDGGARVYWYQLEDGPIWLYERGGAAKALPETTGTGAAFQAASTDGRFTFYTVGGMLHRYDALSEAAPAIATGVAGVLGASASGDTVYYQDGSGLWRWHEGALTELAEGAVAAPSDYPPATGTARVSADGQHLAFLSAAEIPPFDNIDANTGDPDTELYLYGPPPLGGAPRLLCASCNPTGERPHGSATIPGALANGSTRAYKPRVLSASGNRVFFDSADRLVTPDTNSRPDVYEWEADGIGDCVRAPGCVGLISGGRGSGGTFLDASEDGTDAYFLTEESLVGTDPGSIDAYDYRIGGGFPEPEPPFVCKGDACQALPSPPEDPTPGTLVKNSGNPSLKYFAPHKRQGCRKGFVKRGGRCVKRKHGRAHRRSVR